MYGCKFSTKLIWNYIYKAPWILNNSLVCCFMWKKHKRSTWDLQVNLVHVWFECFQSQVKLCIELTGLHFLEERNQTGELNSTGQTGSSASRYKFNLKFNFYSLIKIIIFFLEETVIDANMLQRRRSQIFFSAIWNNNQLSHWWK